MPRLVVIGHIATNESITPRGRHTGLGGSAYYFANGASVLPKPEVGIVASVGREIDLGPVSALADTGGVKVVDSPSAHFTLRQAADGRRSFEARWGAARWVDLTYPRAYEIAWHIHLATAPPQQQAKWLSWIRSHLPHASVSVDAFERFAERWPMSSRAVLAGADLAFLNDEEFALLDDGRWWSQTPYVRKQGGRGATFRAGDVELTVGAENVEPVDTTGAGDVLAGALLALRLIGHPFRNALMIAVSLASASVQEFGMGQKLREQLDVVRGSLREGSSPYA
jgi:sugar/nucleoside kinase (ribokinase family)